MLTERKCKKLTLKPTSKEQCRKASSTTTYQPKPRSNKPKCHSTFTFCNALTEASTPATPKTSTKEPSNTRMGKAQNTQKPTNPKNLPMWNYYDSRSQAMKREREIKKLSHQQKVDLIIHTEITRIQRGIEFFQKWQKLPQRLRLLDQ